MNVGSSFTLTARGCEAVIRWLWSKPLYAGESATRRRMEPTRAVCA